jgi:hypothetical protein
MVLGTRPKTGPDAAVVVAAVEAGCVVAVVVAAVVVGAACCADAQPARAARDVRERDERKALLESIAKLLVNDVCGRVWGGVICIASYHSRCAVHSLAHVP